VGLSVALPRIRHFQAAAAASAVRCSLPRPKVIADIDCQGDNAINTIIIADAPEYARRRAQRVSWAGPQSQMTNYE
jgi:hypothetical protein